MLKSKILVLAFLFIAAVSAETKVIGREVMEKQKKLQSVKSEFEIQKMILISKSGAKETRELRRYIKEVGKDINRTLIAFLGPQDIKGTALLTWQHNDKSDDQWIYLAAQGKLQRIAEGGKKNYFLGTDYTYEDLQSEKLDSFNYQFLRKEKCGGKIEGNCFVIESTPINKKKRKESGYGKKILWVKEGIYITVKVEYYSKRKKLIKTQTTYDWKNVKGTVWRAQKAFMDNHKNNHKTLIASVKIEVDKKIEDKTFTERFILKGEHTK